MNKKEVSEIKKHFKVDDDLMCIDKLLITYIEGDGSIRYKNVISGVVTESDELEYYCDILKQVLSTKVCKNLVEYEFCMENPADGSYTQKLLYSLRDSKFANDDLVDRFVNHVAENSDYLGAYALIVASCRYTMFKKTSDDCENDYESEDYNFLIGAFCPITNTEPTLAYDHSTESFVRIPGKSVISKKATDGFLFPAFCDRSADVNHIMYYTRDYKEPHVPIIDDVFGCRFVMSAQQEVAYFKGIISDVVGGDLNYALISYINEHIAGIVSKNKNETDPAIINVHDIEFMLDACSVPAESIEKLPGVYESYCGTDHFHAVNLLEKKITVTTDGASASVSCNGDIDIHIRPNGEIGLKTSEPTVDINGMTVSVN